MIDTAHLQVLEPFLKQAVASHWGIVLSTTNPNLLKTRLYKCRALLADPAYSGLTFQTSRANPTTEVWIVQAAAAKALRASPPQEPASLEPPIAEAD